MDSKSQRSTSSENVLQKHEREKKKKYLEACLDQRRHFTPFVVSTDGLLGKEAKTLLKRIAVLLSEKWEKPYSEVCGFVRARINMAIITSSNRCVSGGAHTFHQ